MKVILNRDVTTTECHWLEEDIKKGTELFIYDGYTYGCIQPSGTACSLVEGETPFFEVPTDAIQDHVANDEATENDTDDQPFVEVEKLDSVTGEPHPNGIEKGYIKRGAMIKRPTVGESFLVSRIGGYFRTSTVQEVLEDTAQGGKFKTSNSVYKWGLVHETTSETAK